MIRLVDQCRLYPSHCTVFPQIGPAHPLGYFDSGQTSAAGERGYVSVLAAAEMARLLGFQPVGNGRLHEGVIDRLRARIVELEAQLSERDAQITAVHTLKLAGATEGRKPGRPAKVAA